MTEHTDQLVGGSDEAVGGPKRKQLLQAQRGPALTTSEQAA